MNNLYDDPPVSLHEEMIEILTRTANVRIEKIVSTGHASPQGFWYDQSEDEWVAVLRGAARLEFEGVEDLLELREGDHVHIPAGVKHRVAWTAPDRPTIWLAVFYRG